MEEMNSIVATMPAFPMKPSSGVVAKSAAVVPPSSAGGSSLSAGSAAGVARSGTHLLPTSPTFPQDTSERELRPSLVCVLGSFYTSGVMSGSSKDYGIYNSYRYSRYLVLSGQSGASRALIISSLPRAGGKRMDSMVR